MRIDVPGAFRTRTLGITDRGEVAGYLQRMTRAVGHALRYM